MTIKKSLTQILLATFLFGCLAIHLEAAPKILFIRGGAGTVGFFELPRSDEQGASIFNYGTFGGNHSWGELNAALVAEGFSPEEVSENPVAATSPFLTPTPVPLDMLNLSDYQVIVFGSNNATYTAAQINAFKTYIMNGGAALFVSDANFGQNWKNAADGDQQFLTLFGLTMNQDSGVYAVNRATEFIVPAHPIFNGVNSFSGEGISPITRNAQPSGVVSTILSGVPAGQNLRQNNNSTTAPFQGSLRSSNSGDASLVVATLGSGRIAAHFDRNTFFNLNGAGTDINKLQNEFYARNLFNWLAGKPDFNTATDNYAPRGHFTTSFSSSIPSTNPPAVSFSAKDPDGTVSYVDLFLDGVLVSRDTVPPYQWNLSSLGTLVIGNRILTAAIADNEGKITSVQMPIVVSGEIPINRSAWTLSSSVNNVQSGTDDNLSGAIDGNPVTRWATRTPQAPGQRFTINMGQRRLFQRIVSDSTGNPNDYPRGYIVRGSDNGTTYTNITSGTGVDFLTDIILPAPVTYQYVQIEQTGSSTANWWSIHEINILQPPADSALPFASWRQFYFGADLNDPAKEVTHWGDRADLDGDGQSTLEEFAFGTAPNSAASRAPVAATFNTDPVSGSRYFDLTFRRWRTANGIEYLVDYSENLANWTSEGLNVSFVGSPISNLDGTETVTARLTLQGAVPSSFVRLKLVRTP